MIRIEIQALLADRIYLYSAIIPPEVNYFIGIDIGTTHAKAIVVDEEGHSSFEAKKGYTLLRPQHGYEEQDPAAIMDAVTSLLREALSAVPAKEAVAAIGFSAAMHSILPVDQKGEPLYNALIWADTRSSREAAEIRQRPEAELLYANTGVPLHPMSPLCKISWFRNELPAVFENTARFISIKEYVFFHLFGKFLLDHSVAAATGLFNIHEKKWDGLALQIAGIDEGKLSLLVPTTHVEYKLTSPYAALLNTGDTIPFVIGASDGCLANLGSGAAAHGATALTIGTSGAVRRTVRSPHSGLGNERLFIYPLAGDLYVRGGAINNGGIVLEWLAGLLFAGETTVNKYEAILSLAAKAAPGSNGLLFLPYLLGERAPVWDAAARGVFLGLSMRHQREQMARAVLEGICFALYQLIRKLENMEGPVDTIYVSGGFVRSAFWVQLLADMTGKRLCVTETADASALGAACLAMYATGFLQELSEAKRFTRASRQYEPDASHHRIYSLLFPLFDSLYSKLKDDFATLSKLQEN